MTQDNSVKKDRMRYTKDTLSANLLLFAIVADVLYFVNLYQSDVGSYFYNWQIGASVVYNLIFLLAVFLSSEGVKNRVNSYLPLMIGAGIMQFVRIFYIPLQARNAVITIAENQVCVMEDGQFFYMTGCLAVSGILILIACVTSYTNNKTLSNYLETLNKETAER